MWILESEGDFLQGKRLWLKPGKRYLFGRAKKDGVAFAIDHKTISRKHFVIEVRNVKEGDGSHVLTRSKITIADQKSKGGTHIDGKILRGEGQALTGTEHNIKPSTYPHPLRITWHPVVLTFSLGPKERKSSDPLKLKRGRLEQLDVKTILDYVPDKTTHVVAKSRNNAKGLQALIHGKFIVADSYIDALVYAATPADLEEEENLSLLEQDFDAAWPNPGDHLPPPGKEPTLKTADAFAPNLNRTHIFDRWTFIFGEQGQYENLLPAITAGHGKAILLKIENGVTAVDDVVQCMRNAAGNRGFGDVQKDTDVGGVVMVRWETNEEWQSWANDLINQVSSKLNQRSIAQNEFLDAILGNNSLKLRRPWEFASSDGGKRAPPPTLASPSTIRAPATSPPRLTKPIREEAAPVLNPTTQEAPSTTLDARTTSQDAATTSRAIQLKRSKFRAVPISRYKTFDDGFDADSVASVAATEYDDSVDDTSRAVSQKDVGFPSGERVSLVGSEPETSKKRPRPGSEPEDDLIDDLLPAATAMKRRRLEVEKENRRKGVEPEANITRGKVANLPLKKIKKQKKEIDVREAAKEHREAEEEAARLERDALEAGLDDIDTKLPANLVVIEEMEVSARTDRPVRVEGQATNRWDEKWNGRKNFKKFRRQGDANGRRLHTQNVIVPVVEVKKNTYGLGERYWSRSDRDGTSKHKSSAESGISQSQTQTQGNVESEEQTSPAATRLQQEAAEIVGEIDASQPRRTRLMDKTQSDTARSKRPAGSFGGSVAKRQKTIRTAPASDSDSEDLKFRFTRDKR